MYAVLRFCILYSDVFDAMVVRWKFCDSKYYQLLMYIATHTHSCFDLNILTVAQTHVLIVTTIYTFCDL